LQELAYSCLKLVLIEVVVVVVVVVVASNDEGRMENYGAVQNELMVTTPTHQSILLS